MNSKLIKGLDKDDAHIVRAEFKSSPNLIKRLVVLVDEEIAYANKKLRNIEVYRIFHRNEYIADLFGSIRALEDFKGLLLERENANS